MTQLIGRSSSHFTRLVAIVAHELGVPFELVPIYSLKSLEPADYGDNPALKLPTLRTGDTLVFGSENICRTLVSLAGPGSRIVFPHELDTPLARNAQELTTHAMASQVNVILASGLGGLADDNPYLTKLTTSFRGALAWLDANLERALAELPTPRTTSLLEVGLFCLVEHMAFRPTISAEPYSQLRAFAAAFASRPSAQRTGYHFDKPA
jgi:glutathione S-transferase